MNDEIRLLRQYAESDSEAAFAELVRGKVNLVYSAALRQAGGDTHLAEEITQTVFIDLARKARSLTRHPSLAGWLHTCTRFACSKALRARQRRHRHEEARSMDEIESVSARDPEWDRLGPVLDAALGELDARDREVLLLRYFENRPFAEVGACVGLSENSARMRVDRALDKLRGILARRGIPSTAAALGLACSQQAVLAAPAGLAASVAAAALGSAAAIPAGLGLLVFMTKSKLQIALFGLLGLVTLSAVYLQQRTAAELGARDAELQKSAKALADLRSENRRLAAATRPVPAAADPAPDTENAPVASPGPTAASFSFSTAPTAARFVTSLGDDPETKRLTALQQRSSIDRRYAALFEGLGLDPAQREQLAGLLLDRDGAARNAIDALMTKGPGENPAADLNALIAARTTEADEQISRLLGPDAFQRYQDYQATLPQRTLAEQLASRLASTSAPLVGGQLEQLVRALAAAAPPASGPALAASGLVGDQVATFTRSESTESGNAPRTRMMVTMVGGGGTATPPITDAMVNQAQAVLSASQAETLRQMQVDQQTTQALQQRMMNPGPGFTAAPAAGD